MIKKTSIFFSTKPELGELNTGFAALASDTLSLSAIIQDVGGICFLVHKDESVTLPLLISNRSDMGYGETTRRFLEIARTLDPRGGFAADNEHATLSICLRRSVGFSMLFINLSRGKTSGGSNASMAKYSTTLQKFGRAIFSKTGSSTQSAIEQSVQKTRAIAKEISTQLKNDSGMSVRPYHDEMILAGALLRGSRQEILFGQRKMPSRDVHIADIFTHLGGNSADPDPVVMREALLVDANKMFTQRHFSFEPGGEIYMPIVMTECLPQNFDPGLAKESWTQAGQIVSEPADSAENAWSENDRLILDLIVTRISPERLVARSLVQSVAHFYLTPSHSLSLAAGTALEDKARRMFVDKSVRSLSKLMPFSSGWRSADLSVETFLVERLMPLHGYTFAKKIIFD